MRNFQTAANLHREYRQLTDNEVETYNRLMTEFPGHSFPKHAGRIWRYGMLAVMWGNTATILCGGKTNYLANWRIGQ